MGEGWESWVLLGTALAAVVVAVEPTWRWLRWTVAGVLWFEVFWLASRLAVLDLSYTYVADYARGGVARWYRVAGLWGGPGGSLLFFVAALAVVVAAVEPPRQMPRRVLALTVAAVATLVATAASPFSRLAIPAISGAGMQPILEHPAMLYHPPILYAGLVLTAGLWAHATGGSRWSAVSRWAAGTFAVLTVGQMLGANWAYVELGWGGYWGWDPVENGVLVAWLALVATMHAGRLAPRWSHLVAAAPWTAVLFASYITRSGIGGSVHAFADDRATAWALLALVVGTVAASCVLTWTSSAVAPTDPRHGVTVDDDDDGARPLEVERPTPRRRSVQLVGAVIAALTAAIVIEALIYMAVAPNDPVVTGHFYATALAPLAVAAVLASGLALVKTWTRAKVAAVAVGAVAGLALAVAVGANGLFSLTVATVSGAALVALVVVGIDPAARRPAAILAHLGLLVMLVGVAGSTQRSVTTFSARAGDTFTVAGIDFQHRGVEVATEGEIDRVVATLGVSDNGRATTLTPSLDGYRARSSILSESALDSRPSRDLQVVLRGATDDGGATYDVAVTPLVQLVWWGALLMTIGGVLAWSQRSVVRRRSRRQRPTRREPVATNGDSSAVAAAVATAGE